MTREPEVEAALRYVAETVRLLRNNLRHPRPLQEWSDFGRGIDFPGRALKVLEAVEGTDSKVRGVMIQFRRYEERVARDRWHRHDIEIQRRADHDRDVFTGAAGQRKAGDVGVSESEPSTGESRRAVEPPRAAHYALYLFAPSKTRDNMIGDLVETYHEVMLPTFGRSKADLWFRHQVLRTIFAILPSRVVTFFTLRWLYEWVRHAFIGS